tara:strand:- start:118 stop:2013 length:1896 start_codon:yes stop_codon:yes gene_type:complete
MRTTNLVVLLAGLSFITSCGGGGGGGGNDYQPPVTSTNNAPTITNSTSSYSVIENQTSAFSISASDSDGDSLSYSVSGNDASLFNVSSAGSVTFKAAPDFENPSDSDGNNEYSLSATVSDGSLTDSMSFTVVVTNDTSDDETTQGYDGTYLGAGPIQGATICFEAGSGPCAGSSTTTTAQDGSFSLTVDANAVGVLKGEGGFDPITNLQLSEFSSFILDEATTDQNFVVTPLSTLLHAYNSNDYSTFKTKLGLDSTYMIRFDDPFANLNSSSLNKAAVVNTQIMVLHELLNGIHTFTNQSAAYKIADAIYTRTGNETSLGDTTFIKDMLTGLDTGFSPTSDQLANLSAGISAYLQKINANSSNHHSYLAEVGITDLKELMISVMDGTSDAQELDKLVFNTLDWVYENTSWSQGAITDNEDSLKLTSYSLSNNGNSNYIVDGINASQTEFIIYVREGDTIKFEPTSSVTSSHPFLMSTESNDMDNSNDIGTSEGWDAGSLTLTVGVNTPDILYPHCQFHSGMYSNSKIVKVSAFDQSMIDVENNSSALQVKGTVSSGPFKGASGFTYKVYLTPQGGSEHTHTFHEYPGLTFYMPSGQGYHGAHEASNDEKFKPKSHYVQGGNINDGGDDNYD